MLLFGNLKKRYKNLEFTRNKIESLRSQKIIARRDVEEVYSALFLNLATSFEDFLENLFLGLLIENNYVTRTKKVKPKIYFKSMKIARNIVIKDNYYNWLPYESTKKRANHFFKKGLPFTASSIDESMIDRMYYTRNAVAHKSLYAQKKFEEKVIGATNLLPREKRVPCYLRSSGRIVSDPQTRYENFVINILDIAKILCDY